MVPCRCYGALGAVGIDLATQNLLDLRPDDRASRNLKGPHVLPSRFPSTGRCIALLRLLRGATSADSTKCRGNRSILRSPKYLGIPSQSPVFQLCGPTGHNLRHLEAAQGQRKQRRGCYWRGGVARVYSTWLPSSRTLVIRNYPN